MLDTLPASAGDPKVLLAAIAKAAAELAAQETGRRDAKPLTVEDVEEIAAEAVKAAFLRFDIDLSDTKSVRAFNDTISHASRSKGWWDKALATLFTGVVATMTGGLIAAVVKYLSIGGPGK